MKFLPGNLVTVTHSVCARIEAHMSDNCAMPPHIDPTNVGLVICSSSYHVNKSDHGDGRYVNECFILFDNLVVGWIYVGLLSKLT